MSYLNASLGSTLLGSATAICILIIVDVIHWPSEWLDCIANDIAAFVMHAPLIALMWLLLWLLDFRFPQLFSQPILCMLCGAVAGSGVLYCYSFSLARLSLVPKDPIPFAPLYNFGTLQGAASFIALCFLRRCYQKVA
jgi:hypothetical protein